MKKSRIKIVAILLSIMFLTAGCTKQLKNSEGKVVTNPTTGQAVTENILCKPIDEETKKLYSDNKVDISKLPDCKDYKMTSGGYEGLWESIFVKPLAWLILKVGFVVSSMGLGLIITSILFRLSIFPLSQKAAKQSEAINKAKPDLDKIEKKYKDKKDNDSMMKKSQEMAMVYKKYNINPISGCLTTFIQLPLFIAFLEAINRVPAIFEEKFILFQLGTTPMVGLRGGSYYYIILTILVAVSTYYSIFKSPMVQGNEQAKTMNKVMIVMIVTMSIFMSSALNIYWIVTNLFMVVQNLLMKKKKV